MPQLLTLSRAARLVGVTRGVLQKKIRNGELSTFEGEIAITDLLRAYPETQMNDTTMLERVARIKTAAKPSIVLEDRALPSPQVLIARLTTLSKEFIEIKSQLRRYLELIDTLTQKLSDAKKADESHLRSNLVALHNWLKTEIQSHSNKTTDKAGELLAKNTVLRIIAAHVKLIPSGHEFFVEGKDSIIEAALRSGLALNYGCNNGNCGLCKARILSGEVQKIRHHDYIISDMEKQMGYKLMCSHTALTDLVIEAAEAHSVADIPLQQIETKIKKLENMADNLLVLQVQTPPTQTLRFLAGQFATLTLTDGISADYFIASCPCDGRLLEFHLDKAFPTLKKGDTVNIEGPKGDFVLQEDSTRPALFIAQAHGFAPIKSLIEHAMALDTVASSHLYWITPNEGGHYQDNLCRAWADALDNFQYTALTGESGQSLKRVVEDYPDLNDVEVYLSGSKSFVAVAEAMLRQHRLPETQLHVGVY
ncbi:hypothetical protein PN36_14830 [Candidatus Thiomargarita nelsonii]|uniref:2Fe-2S ferredoxin-type domain-containing protein n=1 Tax=Candidatus Thiomargarita nelsonii TaxID=1003181 RepID=A0A0A6PB23_9GAMM|nr:hypothetical protein PN36_14830 [Candidatus Thiomargarita nelsonii]